MHTPELNTTTATYVCYTAYYAENKIQDLDETLQKECVHWINQDWKGRERNISLTQSKLCLSIQNGPQTHFQRYICKKS